MPRYYFHVRDAEGLSVDFEGAEFASDEQACNEAKQAAKELLAERILRDELLDGAQIEVFRADGVLVARIPLMSVMRFKIAITQRFDDRD
ncbi:DUF6894 family protein [Agrobacterium tumefaciens]|uniref:DUF6894 domain-containing protein n=1 Tax=Agrobacterium tumefaciens TaxID=358 RepID=A0A176X1Z3_AGRTU|nr:hypothetical protein A7J57_10540 [Agrobacterium tumefaciens]